MIASILMLLGFKKITKQLSDPTQIKVILHDTVEELLPEIGNAIEEGFKPIVSRVMGILGSKSGISRQLKAAETDIIAAGIDQVTGFGVGAEAAKYLQRYPALKAFLPMVLSQMKQGSSTPANNPVDYGREQ